VIGDIAEQVRSQLSKDYGARPPGLQTVDNGDGSLTVLCDDPAAGLGLQVHISPLQPGQGIPPQGAGMPAPQMPGMGFGPQPMPGYPQQPMMPQQPMPAPQMPGMGFGPQQ